MKTELEQTLQTEDALTNVEAYQPYDLLPNQGTTIPSFYQDDKPWQEAAKKGKLVSPPGQKEINKQMWIGSFMTALIVGLTTKDPSSAIAGGLMGAIAIHDYGNQLRTRGKHVEQLQKDGYSAPAILKWYEDGDESALAAERDDMLARDRFNEGNRDDDRNFAYRQERDKSNDQYRNANMQQRERFQNANLSFRRQTLDMRRQQMNAALAKGQLAERVAGLTPMESNRMILSGMADPLTGKAPTAARIKQAKDWAEGNTNYGATRAGMLNQLDKVDELLKLDIANGTGLEGFVNPALFMSDEAQRVRELITNLTSGQFMANVQNMKGLGALSEAEGARVQNLVSSLDPTLGEAELRRQLAEIQSTMLGAVERLDDEAAFNQWDIGEPVTPEAETASPEAEAAKEVPTTGTHTSSSGIKYEVTKE